MVLKKKEVVLIGNSYGTLLLSLLLLNRDIDLEIYLETIHPHSLFFLDTEEYNLAVSYLHDLEGIVNYVLLKIGINIFDEVEIFNNIESYLLSSNEKLIRVKGIENFSNYLGSIFSSDRDRIEQFFKIIINLGKENMLSVIKEKISLKEIPLFMKYFDTSYKKFVQSFSFKKELENVLLSEAPWDGISLVTMSGYWLQLDSVARFKYGWKSFYEKLISFIKKKCNIFMNKLVKIEKNTNEWQLTFENGEKVCTKVIVFSHGRWILQNFIQGVSSKINSFGKNPSEIYLIRCDKDKTSFDKQVAYVRRIVSEQETKVVYSYVDKNIIKMEYICNTRDFLEKDKSFLEFEIIKSFTPQQLQQITGIYNGILSLWAHSVDEIKNNPLQNLKVYDGIYCLGDWGNGYFFASEFYSREIFRYLGYAL